MVTTTCPRAQVGSASGEEVGESGPEMGVVDVGEGAGRARRADRPGAAGRSRGSAPGGFVTRVLQANVLRLSTRVPMAIGRQR